MRAIGIVQTVGQSGVAITTFVRISRRSRLVRMSILFAGDHDLHLCWDVDAERRLVEEGRSLGPFRSLVVHCWGCGSRECFQSESNSGEFRGSNAGKCPN